MRRRRFVLGAGTIVLGSSGFVASGAVDVGSLGGGGGGNWVRVDQPDIEEIDTEPTDDDDDTADDTADDTDDEPTDDTDPEEDDPEGEVRVQVVTDPFGGGSNRVGELTPAARVVDSDLIRADDRGFLDGIDLASLNPNATTRIGRVGPDGSASDEVAFLIANVGGVGQDRGGRSVEIRMSMFSQPQPGDPAESINVDGLRFPFRTSSGERGRNLLDRNVRLRPREIIHVVLEVDATASTRNLERVESVGFAVRQG